jgi:hypothetical protein
MKKMKSEQAVLPNPCLEEEEEEEEEEVFLSAISFRLSKIGNIVDFLRGTLI